VQLILRGLTSSFIASLEIGVTLILESTPQDFPKKNMALSDTIWWTKKARIKAEKRLLFNDISSQIILLWYSLFTVCVSIFELKEPSTNGYFAVIMVSLSVLILCASLFIGNRNFKERAMLLKQCYEQLSEVEAKTRQNDADINILGTEYQNILSVSENHSEIDFKYALVSEYLNSHDPKKDLTRTPTKYNVFEVILYVLYSYLKLLIFILIPPLVVMFLRCS